MITLVFIGLCAYLGYNGHWIWMLIIALIGLVIGIVIGFFYFLGVAFEGGMRNKYPIDFVGHIQWVNDYLKEKGFVLTERRNIGGDYPECVFCHEGQNVIVRLNAPLMTTKPYSMTIIVSGTEYKEWFFSVNANRHKVIEGHEKSL